MKTVNEAGYRLYDDKAIDKLGQILVFKELDIPLADIKLIMENPDLDSRSVLAKQREMLCLKKQRIERIIAGIDDMLKALLMKKHKRTLLRWLNGTEARMQ